MLCYLRWPRAQEGFGNLRLQMLDTSGQERFRLQTVAHCRRNCDGYLVFFNRTRRETFDILPQFLRHVNSMGFRRPETIIAIIGAFVVTGTYSDLETVVSYEEAKEFADSNGASYHEVCCWDGPSVHNAVFCILDQLVEQPPPPPMPPDWSEWAWEKKKTELAAERLRRQCQEEEERAAPSPPPCAAPPGRGVPSPSEDLPNNWRPWRCPIFPWQKAEERRPSKPSRRSPGQPSSASEAKEDPGPNEPGAGFGRAWNWGAGIFSGHSKVGALNSAELARQEVQDLAEG
ncbi:Rab14 [Symbiodinium sp. CCMP2592]|nr:Rab14 [Symbiodinium sp. CCMP2592]